MRGPRTAKQSTVSALAICFFALTPLALVLPDHFLAGLPTLSSAVGAIGKVAGSVDKLGSVSDFPDPTRTVLAVCWLMCPFLMVWVYLGLSSERDEILAHYRRLRWKLLFLLPIMSYAFIWLPVSMHLLDPAKVEHGRSFFYMVVRAASHHRLGLGLLSSAFGFTVAVMTALVMFCLLNSRSILLREKIQ